MTLPQKTRIVLVGKAASGKDHLRKTFEKRGFRYGVSYTTRPSRPGEVDGKDYHFLTDSDFETRKNDGFFYEAIKFNGWSYGTSKDQWLNTDDIFIMTPSGVSKIHPEDRKNTFIIYIDIPIEIRRERLKMRSDNNDSIERRLSADDLDFAGFSDYDMHITTDNF